MTIRFYLHNKATAGRHPIYMEVRWGGHPAAPADNKPGVRLGTREGCAEKHWTKKQLVSTADLRSNKVNGVLKRLRRTAEDLLDTAQQSGVVVTEDQMRETLLATITQGGRPAPTPEPSPAPTLPTIGEVAAQWKDFYKAKYSQNYLRKVDPVVGHWDTFRPGTTLVELLPDPVTRRSDLVEQWCEYLVEEAPNRYGGFGLESNTVGRYVAGLRQLLKFAGLHYAWLTDEYTYEVEIDPLTFEEVEQLYAALMPTEHLTQVRDVFVFNCFTGPRYGNLRGLQPSDVTTERGGTRVLSYVQIKGRRKKTKVRVALDPIAVEIWERYNGRLPVKPNQEMNESIKEAARAAGLDRELLQVRQRGPHRIERRGPLWEFITCHVARHTFATLLLDGDADLGQVQVGLGHSAIQTTRRYAKSREPKRHEATLSAFEKLRASHTDASGV